MDVYCSSITVAIKFTWHDFSNDGEKYRDAWGLTTNFLEQDNVTLKKKVPKSADVELNTRLLAKYYWDKTPGDTKDDKDFYGKELIDAASVLKHEVFHAIGLATGYSVYKAAAKEDGDPDKDGKNESYLDYNNNGKYDSGELVLKDGDPNHTDDGFYKNKESFLMGIPGFGWGQQARPSRIEINSLHEVYGYSVHIPEPSTLAIWSVLGTIGITFGWRRRWKAA